MIPLSNSPEKEKKPCRPGKTLT